jgi:hypothetical protein
MAGTGSQHRRGHLRLQPRPQPAASEHHRRRRPRRSQRTHGDAVRQRPAEHPPPRRHPARTGTSGEPGAARQRPRRVHLRHRAPGPARPAHRDFGLRQRRAPRPVLGTPRNRTAGGAARQPPFGVLRHETYRLAHLELQPGDRLVLLTDGMLERGAAALDLPDRLQHLEGLAPQRGRPHPERPRPRSRRTDPAG